MQRLTSWCPSLILLLSMAHTVAADDVQVIELRGFKFIPEEVTIKRGTTVRWVNVEKRQYHNVWFRAAGDESTEYLFPGDSYERKFDSVGEFPYICEPHEDRMRGVIHVVE